MIEDHFHIARQLSRLSSNLLERAVIHAHNFNLGVTEVRAIEQLLVTGSMTAKELGQSLALTSGSVTALVNRLVKNGLVDRSADSNDRRKVKITLVPDQIPRLSTSYMLYAPEFLERLKNTAKLSAKR
jgi:DNA-binding MarR family transcriptional regulator